MLPQNWYCVLALSLALFTLHIDFALASGKAPAEEPEAGEITGSYKVTRPMVRNPLPPDIIDRMRKELMVLMGVEPEKTDEADKAQKSGH